MTQQFGDIQLRDATREKLKGRIGLTGPSGSGKTVGALLLAFGLVGQWEDIAIIDSEGRRGELYTGVTINGTTVGRYKCITLGEPYHPDRYIHAMQMCEQSGIKAIITDSISHTWEGTGGMLEQKDIIAKRGGNSYFAWRDITPQHNRLLDHIMRSPAHMIVCCRQKVEHGLETDAQGKIKPVKIGMKPIYREGLEYEFQLFFDVAHEDHLATASKDNTNIFGQQPFLITPDTGKIILEWLNTGQEPQHWQQAWQMIANNPWFVLNQGGVAQLTTLWYDLLKNNGLPLDMQTWTFQESMKAIQVINWYVAEQSKAR